ncbi:MAG: hypothetical protein ACHQ49_06130 [Elusimicrobiota bacterium]
MKNILIAIALLWPLRAGAVDDASLSAQSSSGAEARATADQTQAPAASAAIFPAADSRIRDGNWSQIAAAAETDGDGASAPLADIFEAARSEMRTQSASDGHRGICCYIVGYDIYGHPIRDCVPCP